MATGGGMEDLAAGAVLLFAGAMVVGGVGGALIGGPKHRVLGGALGIGAGILAVKLAAAVRNATPRPALPPVTSLHTGQDYLLSGSETVAGGTALAATSAGFTNVGPNANGVIHGVWGGADGAPVPAGINIIPG